MDEILSPFPMQKQFFINFNTGLINDYYDMQNAKALKPYFYSKLFIFSRQWEKAPMAE